MKSTLNLKIKQFILSLISLCVIQIYSNAQAPINWIKKYQGIRDCRNINFISYTKDKKIWAFTQTGVHEIGGINEKAKLIRKEVITRVVFSESGEILYEQGGRLYYTNEENFKDTKNGKILSIDFLKIAKDSFKYAQPSNGLAITSLCFDKYNGFIWVGTNGFGLFYLNIPSVTNKAWRDDIDKISYNQEELVSLPLSRDINALCENNGILWIGTNIGILKGINLSEKKHLGLQYFCKDNNNNIRTFNKVNEEVWAISNERNIFYCNETLDEKKNKPITRLPDDISNIFIDNAKDLWMISTHGTLIRYKDFDNKFANYTKFSEAHGLSRSTITSYTVDENNIIWLGTIDKGLYYLTKTPAFYVTESKPIRCNNEKNALIKLQPIEGKSPFNFFWYYSDNKINRKENVNTNESFTISNLEEGRLYIVIKDANNLVDTFHWDIKNPNKVQATLEVSELPYDENTKEGSEIFINTVHGGRADKDHKFAKAYTYTWSSNPKVKDYACRDCYAVNEPITAKVCDTLGCCIEVSDTIKDVRRFSQWECETIRYLKEKDNKDTKELTKFNIVPVCFQVDKSDFLSNSDSAKIIDIKLLLSNFPKAKINIYGYTQASNKPKEYHTNLSNKRVEKVTSIIEKLGFANRIDNKEGRGSIESINKTNSNSKVEIEILFDKRDCLEKKDSKKKK